MRGSSLACADTWALNSSETLEDAPIMEIAPPGLDGAHPSEKKKPAIKRLTPARYFAKDFIVGNSVQQVYTALLLAVHGRAEVLQDFAGIKGGRVVGWLLAVKRLNDGRGIKFGDGKNRTGRIGAGCRGKS